MGDNVSDSEEAPAAGDLSEKLTNSYRKRFVVWMRTRRYPSDGSKSSGIEVLEKKSCGKDKEDEEERWKHASIGTGHEVNLANSLAFTAFGLIKHAHNIRPIHVTPFQEGTNKELNMSVVTAQKNREMFAIKKSYSVESVHILNKLFVQIYMSPLEASAHFELLQCHEPHDLHLQI
ncbi:hypothetical protein RUM44_010099 [Polyplax serrata]|uniref:Uncharacterized protein n=1 Tax=Polyplax serrata TaxID=468196 RepID=A0ABR1AV82_POLSC